MNLSAGVFQGFGYSKAQLLFKNSCFPKRLSVITPSPINFIMNVKFQISKENEISDNGANFMCDSFPLPTIPIHCEDTPIYCNDHNHLFKLAPWAIGVMYTK